MSAIEKIFSVTSLHPDAVVVVMNQRVARLVNEACANYPVADKYDKNVLLNLAHELGKHNG